jgi:hypothetical protein
MMDGVKAGTGCGGAVLTGGVGGWIDLLSFLP